MQTKRDQLQAYTFVVGRVKAAVLRANPDGASIPFRRSTSSTIVGVLVTLLVSGISLVIGLLFPGSNTSWRQGTDVVLAEESGARYVLLQGVLHPVLNYTSAKLVLGKDAGVVSVSAASLEGAPRGVPIGIPGAPDAIPEPDQLLTGAPMSCSRPAVGGDRPRLLVAAGIDVPVRPTDAAVLVRGPEGDEHVVWQGQRFRVADRSVPQAMGLTGRAREVPQFWLNTLLPRADLRPPEIPGLGERSVAVPGLGALRVGQVVAVDGVDGERRFLVALSDGLAPVTQFAAALIVGDPRASETGSTAAMRTVSASTVAALPQAELAGVPGSWPLAVPPVDGAVDEDVLCTVLPSGSAADDPPDLLAAPADELAAVVGPLPADRDLILMRPGAGLLAQASAVPGATSGALYFVSDLGVRHAIPSAQAADALGLSPALAVGVSAELLAGIPEGPALDPVAALTPQPVEPPRGSS
jgi:type VII secretion protein EccB